MITANFLSRQRRFADLCLAVQQCTLCPRLKARTKVLSAANGNLDSKVLFIAEAPGRLGADVTGVPLYGDRSGETFGVLLDNIGWHREDVFVTNAVLCNPRDEQGNNAPPTATEVANCAAYLEMTMELVQAEVLVTLGTTALEALANIREHAYTLAQHAGRLLPWAGRALMPLYHSAPRALIHRPLAMQACDYATLARTVDPRRGMLQPIREEEQRRYSHALQRLAYTIVQSVGPMTYFKLTKLLYLVDLSAIRTLGRSLTGEIYLRQKEGPWPPKLPKMVEALDGREITRSFRRSLPVVAPGPSPRLETDFDMDELEVIAGVIERYGELDNASIKIAVYRTAPMRYILQQEKQGRNMSKVPVIYRDRVAPDTDYGVRTTP